MIPLDDLEEIPLGNSDFLWFTDGSYLKGDNSKYCAGYPTTTPFDVEAASLPMANRLNYMLLHGLVLQPRTKLPVFILIVDIFSE